MKVKKPRFFFNRAITFTFEGKAVVGLAIGTGFAAVNTGNNLLYIIFSFLISLIIISGILSEMNLKRINVKTAARTALFAGRIGYLPHRLENVKKKLTSYSLSVKTEFSGRGPEDQVPGYLLSLRPGGDSIASEHLTASKRGRYGIRGLTITTGYPFSFFRKILRIDQEGILMVYPEMIEIPADAVNEIIRGDDSAINMPGRGLEFLSTRDMRQGDDVRKILWKHYARTGKMIVREYEDPLNKEVVLIVDNVSAGKGGAEKVEREISLAASLSVKLIPEGYSVGLETGSGSIAPRTGGAHLRGILEFLAVLPVLGRETGA
ncbi:MAG: DUF58 domain-containing protein [Deltaproteobacteria bacterium]|nr:DUF58 domain-containing protein [Deltaproteobacteria bacterium]